MYVLNPVLQAGEKIPCWQPRSCRGVFVGFSPRNSSDVLLILNLQTEIFAPHYHVVFEDTFTTVESIPEDRDPPSFWNEIDLEAKSLQIPLDSNVDTSLQDDWLTTEELEENPREKLLSEFIRVTFDPNPSPAPSDFSADSKTKLEDRNDKESSSPIIPLTPTSTSTLPILSTLPLRVSSRSNKVQHPTRYINEAYLSLVSDPPTSSHKQALAYNTAVQMDIITGIMNCTDQRAYVIKTRKGKYPDNPLFREAMHG